MQTRAIGISMRLEGDGFEEVHVCHNGAHRSAYSDYVHPENLQVSIGSILTLFGPPELVVNVLRDLLEQSEAAVAEANRAKEVA
jgi:hypothetical protein